MEHGPMGRERMFTIVDGQVVVQGEPLSLPENFFDPEFLKASFNTPVHEPGALHRLARLLDPAGRQRLKQVCQASGPELSDRWQLGFADWASIACPTGHWLIEQLRVIYREQARTWLIDDVIVDTFQRQFVVAPPSGIVDSMRLVSFAEFQLRHGISVQAHLLQFASVEQRRIDRLLSDLQGRVVMRDLDLIGPDGQRKSFILYGLDSVPLIRWERPRGWLLPDELKEQDP